ncbi:hypothetical protein LT493_29290 [Streptomyces tricolor]|nr:hypothetical protein [Streptomyces tricolor]
MDTCTLGDLLDIVGGPALRLHTAPAGLAAPVTEAVLHDGGTPLPRQPGALLLAVGVRAADAGPLLEAAAEAGLTGVVVRGADGPAAVAEAHGRRPCCRCRRTRPGTGSICCWPPRSPPGPPPSPPTPGSGTAGSVTAGSGTAASGTCSRWPTRSRRRPAGRPPSRDPRQRRLAYPRSPASPWTRTAGRASSAGRCPPARRTPSSTGGCSPPTVRSGCPR